MTAVVRSRGIRVIIGLVVGALVGLAVFQASSLTGRNLYLLAGSVAGGVAAFAAQAYSRTARLTGVTLTIPQLSALHFAVTKDSQNAAWKLFVESVTRIAVQPLDADGGRLREAMTSLHSLFGVTRELLAQNPPSVRTGREPTVEHLAIAMLNNELRPYLTRWHPRLTGWEQTNPGRTESDWPDNAECRADLAAVQANLRQYTLGFGALAGLDPRTWPVLGGRLRMAGSYDAFISYSQRHDRVIARLLHRAVERLGKPWWERRALTVFRDETDLSAHPELWEEIKRRLARSTWLVVLASPAATESIWVDREIRWWLANRSSRQILIVHTGGRIAWDDTAGDFDRAISTAVPEALVGVFPGVPRWVEACELARLLGERTGRKPGGPRDRRCGELVTAVAADIAATIHGRTKSDLIGTGLRQHRIARATATPSPTCCPWTGWP